MKYTFKPSRLSPIAKIYAIAIPLSLIFMFSIGYMITTDARSYFNAWQSLQNGNLDPLRTPVYPVIVGCIESIFGTVEFVKTREVVSEGGEVFSYFNEIAGPDSSLVAYSLVGLQFIVFLISLTYFYKLARMLTHSERSSVGITLLYAIFIIFSGINNKILTESISLSATIFFLYSFVQSIKKGSNLYVFSSLFWSLFLIFLRPSFLFIPCCTLFLGVCLLFINKYRKSAAKNIVASFVVMLAVLVYCYQFKNEYGYFSPTLASVANKYMVATSNSDIPTEACKIEDDALRTHLLDLHALIRGEKVVRDYGVEAVDSLASSINASNREQYFKNILKRLKSACVDYSIVWSSHKTGLFSSIQRGLKFKLGLELFVLLLYVVLIFYWRKSRPDEELIYLFFILMLSFSNWIVAIIAAPNEFSRLLMANVPLFFLLAADLVVRLVRRKRKKQAEETANQ